MTIDRNLDEILAEIGRNHRTIVAPERLEPVLRAAAYSRKCDVGFAMSRIAWVWAGALMLLIAVATGVVWQTRKTDQKKTHEARSAPQVAPDPMRPPARSAGLQTGQPNSALIARRKEPASFRKSPKRAASNSLDEFVPLPVSEGLPPAAELSVVRIKLRGSDLRQYGLEAPADAVAQTMLAEFVVGEDGLPRAIRIVR